ncbi:MAG: hypothetical protein V4488_25885 [Pseudomonadota bacterium]
MATPRESEVTASCQCGQVAFKAFGTPITSAVCYCADCQAGSRHIETLANAPVVQDRDGGTAYLVFRKDRVTAIRGASLLKGYKLREKSATNRVVATCCNSAMMLNFDDSKHWVSMYRARFQGDILPIQMRICTSSKPGKEELPSDVPSFSSYPLRFIARLIAARIAMLFHR